MTMLVLQGSAGSANFTLFSFTALFFAENPIFLRFPGSAVIRFWIYGAETKETLNPVHPVIELLAHAKL